jgi:tetratricopeptide (TPR) repeat protein
LKDLIIELLEIIWPFMKENTLVLILCAVIILIIIFVVKTMLDELIRRIIRNNKKRVLYRKLGRATDLLDKGYKIRADEMFAHVIDKSKYDESLAAEARKARSKAFMHPMAQNLELALKDADRAIQLDGKDGDAYIVRGRVYSLKGEHDKAIEDFSKATICNTTREEEVYLYLGIEYYILKEYESANVTLNMAIRLNPNYSDALFYRGNTYYSKEEYIFAIRDYNRALKIDPKNLIILNNIGCAYSATLDYNRAMKVYNKVLKIEPYYPHTIRNRALLFYNKGYHDRAIKEYNFAVKAEPYYYAKLIKKFYFDEDGIENYNNTIDYSRLAQTEKEKKAVILFKRGNAYAQKKDYNKAINDYNQAIENSKDNKYILAQLLVNRGNVYKIKNDFTRSISDYNAALEIEPDNSWIYNNRGNLYFALGDYERAISDYNMAIEKNPNDGLAKVNLFNAEKMAEQKRLGTENAV